MAAAPRLGRAAAAALLASAVAFASGCAGTSGAVAEDNNIAALQSELSRLESEATRAADVSAIKRLQRTYGYYLDRKLWDDMAGLFASDGTIEIALDGVYVGQKRVREYLYALGGGRPGSSTAAERDTCNCSRSINVADDGSPRRADGARAS